MKAYLRNSRLCLFLFLSPPSDLRHPKPLERNAHGNRQQNAAQPREGVKDATRRISSRRVGNEATRVQGPAGKGAKDTRGTGGVDIGASATRHILCPMTRRS